MRFVTATQPPQGAEAPAWWFLFAGQKILAKIAGKAGLPLLRGPSVLGLKPIRALYLGTLDGVGCFLGEMGAEPELPAGMSLVGLRQLFGAVDEELFRVAGRAFQTLEFERNHRYCGACGRRTEDKQEERAKVCPEWWRSRRSMPVGRSGSTARRSSMQPGSRRPIFRQSPESPTRSALPEGSSTRLWRTVWSKE